MRPEDELAAYNKAKLLLARADELVDEGRFADADQMRDAACAIEQLDASPPTHPWRSRAVWLVQVLQKALRRGLSR